MPAVYAGYETGIRRMNLTALTAISPLDGRYADKADDLRIHLRPEGETRERQRHGDAGLEDEVGAEEEKENEKKNDIDQRDYADPAEVVLLRAGELHRPNVRRFSLAIAAPFALTGRSSCRLLERDDVARRFGVGQHVHDFDPGAFHLVHDRVHA